MDLSKRMLNLNLQALKASFLHHYRAYIRKTWQSEHLRWGAIVCLFPQFLRSTNFGRLVTYLDGLLPIKSHDPLITWSPEITWKTKTIISPMLRCLRAMGKVMTYHKGLSQVKPYDPFIMWSCEITWQTKSIIFLLPKCAWPSNLVRW